MKTFFAVLALCLLGVNLRAGGKDSIEAELKFLDLPTFRTGESGPLWGRVVLTYKSDRLEPLKARVSLKIGAGASWQEGEWIDAWPGIPSSLPVAITLDSPEAENRVHTARLRVELGDKVVLSRLVDLFVREHGMFFRSYRSRLDDSVYPYALYLPQGYDSPGRSWPLVVSLHGAYSNYANNLKRLFGIGNRPGESDELALRSFPTMPVLPPVAGIVVCPWGRGTMSYHGPGERDVLDVLEIVREQYAVDPGRIGLTGLSMGGNGTWEMALRHPGIFSAAVPVCPPADMNLSDFYVDVLSPQAGKFPFIEQIFEQNQIANWALNAKAFPIHIYHGTDDPVVPIHHSHEMVKALAEQGIEAPLSTFDNVGHNAWDPAYENGETLRRLMGAVRETPARVIEFTTCRYQHARYQWLEITRFETYGDYAVINAIWNPDNKKITLQKTTNVAALDIYPDDLGLESGDKLTVGFSGGNSIGLTVKDSSPLALTVSCDKIRQGGVNKANIKRKGVEGPIWEALSDRVLLVFGTGPGGEETLRRTLRFVDWGDLPDTHFIIRPDTEVSNKDMIESHLVLFGDERSNKLIARINAKAPVRFDGDKVVAGKHSYPRDEISFKCVFPNPLEPGRLVMVNYAEEWDYSKLWSFQGVFKTLPDYMIYRRGGTRPFSTEMLAAGFFAENWDWQD
ncbi:MAG: prolyl oligopeptidase family serine peptidase [Candidatus Glassbacteria bacterium]|nr:prolyl oligopeptidase family serine peptidase [Candidatus Glassbacteria bacterium]